MKTGVLRSIEYIEDKGDIPYEGVIINIMPDDESEYKVRYTVSTSSHNWNKDNEINRLISQIIFIYNLFVSTKIPTIKAGTLKELVDKLNDLI